MSWNKLSYQCTCGTCVECKGRAHASRIYSAPQSVQVAFFQKKASEEDELIKGGKYIPVNCPQCNKDRLVLQASLKNGFSCDKCGFRA